MCALHTHTHTHTHTLKVAKERLGVQLQWLPPILLLVRKMKTQAHPVRILMKRRVE